MVESRPSPIDRISWNPDFLGDLVGGRETDAVDILRQRVRILAHLFNCLRTIGLEYPYGSAGADTMAVQEQHDLANLFRLLPCMGDPLPPLGANPVHGLQFGDLVLDDAQNLGS